MTDPNQACALPNPDSHPSYHTSFILRCWLNTPGQVRARLIDVGSGRGYPVAHLADLPDLVRKLLSQDGRALDTPPQTERKEAGDESRFWKCQT